MTIFFLLDMNFYTAIFVSHMNEDNFTYFLVKISAKWMLLTINYYHFYIIYVNIYTYV